MENKHAVYVIEAMVYWHQRAIELEEKLVANHTVDCQWCGEDIRTMSVSTVAAHEDTCRRNPKNILDDGEPAPPKIDDLVEAYVGIRDALSAARKQFKAFELKAKEDMTKIEVDLLEQSRKLGVNSFKTDHGTAYKTDKDFARVAGPEGWIKLVQYMVEHNDFGLVEKRVAKLHFKEIMAEEAAKEEGGLAPVEMGVEYVVEEAIQVRRS